MKRFLSLTLPAAAFLLPVAFVLFVFYAPAPDDDERPPLGIIMRNGHTDEELKQCYLTVDPVAQNMQQSGANDRQIPVETRQDWAVKHGIAQPNE